MALNAIYRSVFISIEPSNKTVCLFVFKCRALSYNIIRFLTVLVKIVTQLILSNDMCNLVCAPNTSNTMPVEQKITDSIKCKVFTCIKKRNIYGIGRI